VKNSIKKREDIWISKNISSLFSLISCFIIAPTFILQQQLLIKGIQFVILFLLLCLNKNKLHLKGGIIFFFITVIFHMIFPEGRVLFKMWGFPFTLDALLRGCSKALTLLGLLYLSKIFIYLTPLPAAKPGKITLFRGFRNLLDKTLFYFYCLLEQQKRIKFNKIWQSLDEIIINAYKNSREVRITKKSREKTTVQGMLFVISLALLNWFFVVIQYID